MNENAAVTPKARIEAWALSVIDRCRKGERIEDDLVEAKSNWIEPHKAARRIAALANAARSEPILFLIGLKECVGPVATKAEVEFATWWEQVSACFDPEPPRLTHLIVEGVDVLHLDPDRSPYVVEYRASSKQSSGVWEVPWREGTRTRSARHSDLVRILVPRARTPEFDLLEVRGSSARQSSGEYHLFLTSVLYVSPQTRDRIVLPNHRSWVEARFGGDQGYSRLASRLEGASGDRSKTVYEGSREVVVDGPGELVVKGSSAFPLEKLRNGLGIELQFHFDPLPETDHVLIEARVPYAGTKDGDRHFWGAEPPSNGPRIVPIRRSSWVQGWKRWT